jgi:hypothetical protein
LDKEEIAFMVTGHCNDFGCVKVAKSFPLTERSFVGAKLLGTPLRDAETSNLVPTPTTLWKLQTGNCKNSPHVIANGVVNWANISVRQIN